MKDLSILQQAKTAAASLAEHERALRTQHAAAIEEREQIGGSPEPSDAVIQNMEADVDRRGAHFADEFGYAVVHAYSRRLELQGDGTLEPRGPGYFDVPSWVSVSHLCGLVPELVKTRLATIIRQTNTAPGVAFEARRAAIARLDERIASLEAEHSALVDQATELGIRMELLPAVKARREADAAKQQREADAIAARERAEAELNRRLGAADERAQRSGYVSRR